MHQIICFVRSNYIVFLLLFVLIIFAFNYKNIIKIGRNIYSRLRKYFKEDFHKIEFKNIPIILLIITICTIFFEVCRYSIPNLINFHLNINIEINYFEVYGCVISLILPLSILLIERINDNKDYIRTETYLSETKMFPSIIFFCTTLILLIIVSDIYYFLFVTFISVVMIIAMYYKSFKLLSNYLYEQKKCAKTRNDLINKDLNEQLGHFSSDNKIGEYENLGIIVENYNYLSTHGYKQIDVYPNDELSLIKGYNYKYINKIACYLNDSNKIYIDNGKYNEKQINLDKSVEPNIIVYLKDIGYSIKKQSRYMSIYYKDDYKNVAENIARIPYKKIYITSENNTRFYVKKNYEFIQIACTHAINESSNLTLEIELKKYLDIYKDYVDGVKKNIGDYDYATAYNHKHAIFGYRVYEFLELISKDIINYANMIVNKKDFLLMNTLISFLYQMILYSYEKKELLSIEYLYGLYANLVNISFELTKNNCIDKIKLEIFEFMMMIKYDLSENKNISFNKDALIICNKTLSKIIYNLFDKDKKIFKIWNNKTNKFIEDLREREQVLSTNYNDITTKLKSTYEMIINNFLCNFFVTYSYIIHKTQNFDDDNINYIYNLYNNYDSMQLTNIYLNTIEMDYKDHTYSWDFFEEKNCDEYDGFGYVGTIDYITHLYCCLLSKKRLDEIHLEISYPLITRIPAIIEELKNINSEIIIEKFNNLVDKYNAEKENKLKNSNISEERIENFIDKFNIAYGKNSVLYNLMNITDNIKVIEEKKAGKNYLGISNIVDKTYFIDQNSIDETIIWDNYERSFADSFINGEESKYASLIMKNAILQKMDIKSFINQNSLKSKDLVIFAGNNFFNKHFNYNDITWKLPEDKYNPYQTVASKYFINNDNYIPIITLENMDDNIYLYNINNLGSMCKSKEGFIFDIKSFNDKKLLDKIMKEKIIGLHLMGDERKLHLLKSVQVIIKEYIEFEEENMDGYKFNNYID